MLDWKESSLTKYLLNNNPNAYIIKDNDNVVREYQSEIFNFYHNDKTCFFCNKQFEYIGMLDGNINNVLLTNLIPLCSYHIKEIYEYPLPYITITKEFRFESCHQLLNYDGPCKNLHGHSYKLQVSIRRKISSETDMVMDFKDLKHSVQKYVIDILDHSFINEDLKGINPTAENMLVWIWSQLEKNALLKGLIELKLWETESSFATLTYKDLLQTPSLYLEGYMNDIKK